MESTNRSGLQCQEHPREQITNFCIQYGCLKPLCPDCVQVHTKVHQKQQIESWKHCVNKTASNVKTTLDQLRSIYEYQNQYRSGKSVDTIENQNVRKLAIMRERMHKLVDEVYNNHENMLRACIRSQYRNDAPDTAKLKMAIEEMEKLLMKLGHSSSVLPALKRGILLDHGSIVDYFANLKTRERREVFDKYVQENTSRLGQVRTALENSIQLYRGNTEDRIDSLNRDIYDYNEAPHMRIFGEDYFLPQTANKLLHFFIPDSNELQVLRVEQAAQRRWQSLVVASNVLLPIYFKSIITPKGDIYLTGGSNQQGKCKEIYKYNYGKNSLDLVASMLTERSSHALCYLDQCIYLLGGLTNKQSTEATRDCEVLNLRTMTCQRIAQLNTPSANSCAAAYNNGHIFKFGGTENKLGGNSVIQMYEVNSNRWSIVSIDSQQPIELASFCAALQVNETDMLIFGGYDNTEQQNPLSSCFVATVNVEKCKVQVRNNPMLQLPFAEGFWNNNPLLHKNKVYALQNVPDEQNGYIPRTQERRLLIFDGAKWL